jgi:hypothetical protein
LAHPGYARWGGKADIAKVFDRSTASKLPKQRLPGDDDGMARGRYWDGPEGAHRSYCAAVAELSDKFMRERKIVPEIMTADQARGLLKERVARMSQRIARMRAR